jgi:hypothetical protein
VPEPGVVTDKLIVKDEYLNEEQLLSLPMFQHLKPATLARWRSEGRGPRCTIVGRQPFYWLGEVYRWLKEEEETSERARKVGKVALQIQGRGHVPRRIHRLGGHQTKSERRESN